MLKARITYKDALIEGEASSKRELEDALEAALNAISRMNNGTHAVKAFREPETQAAPTLVRDAPPQPTQAAGGTPPPHKLQYAA